MQGPTHVAAVAPSPPVAAGTLVSGAGQPVILALHGDTLPTASLYRALAIARLQGVELHVARVLPEVAPMDPLFPQDVVARSVGGVLQEMAVVHTTSAWLAAHVPDHTRHRLEVLTGPLCEVVARHARRWSAGLIVMPPLPGAGAMIGQLALDAGIPVLVGREATTAETIVAATDLKDEATPVLWDAALLARRLDVPLVAVHNHAPWRLSLGPDLAPRVSVLPSGEAREAMHRITQAASHLPVAAEPVLREEQDAIAGILGEARALDADMIAVGIRPRALIDDLADPGVAAAVLDAASRSVLVVPLPDGGSV